MKLSNETLHILKNFASISSGLYVPGGSKLRVKNSKASVLAEAAITETFPEFAVAELNKFLGILTVDKDVDIDFKGSDVIISLLQGRSKINYRCSAKTLVNVPKNNDLTIGDGEGFATFTLTKDVLAFTEKILSLLGLGHVAIEYDGTKLFLRVFDPKNDSENQQTFDLDGGTVDAESFQLIFMAEYLDFVPGNYLVTLSKERAQFKHTELNVTYWVAPEMESTVNI